MPPQIVKQEPPKPTSQIVTGNGSILSTAVPVSAIKEKWVKMCLYGRNRIGKTTLACQFPKPLLLIAMEPTETGGAMSVTNIEGIHVIQISHKKLRGPDGKPEKFAGTAKALTLAAELAENNPFATVVLDTATAFQDIILSEIMGLSAVPEMLSWGMVGEEQYRDRSSKTREALRPFLDLKCHVVVTAQEKDHNPPKDRGAGSKLTRTLQQESFMAADLGGATVKWLQDACGYIGQLYQDKEIIETTTPVKVGNTTQNVTTQTETGKIVRRLRTLYHPNFAAGFRSPTPNAVPEYIEAATPNEMYVEMMKVIAGVKTGKGKY